MASNPTGNLSSHFQGKLTYSPEQCREICDTYLWVEVEETVVFEPQQKHFILLHVLFHQGPWWVQPPVHRKKTHCQNFYHWKITRDTTEFDSLTLGWFLLYPEVTGACRVWPGCLARRWAGWRRGCWDCLRTAGCPQTRRWWARVGCRLWSRRSGSSSCCTGPDWSRCSLQATSRSVRFRWWKQ